MAAAGPPEDRPLADGERVVVRRTIEFHAVVRRGAGPRIVLEPEPGTDLPDLSIGEQVTIRTAIPGDASYETTGRVVEAREDVVRVQGAGTGRRVQQRRFVRVSVDTPPVVHLRDQDDAPREGQMLDVSAGGMRAAVPEGTVTAGTPVEVSFALPRASERDQLPVVVSGEVVWTRPLQPGRMAIGIEFADADATLETQLTAWVYEQQRRRAR